MSPKSTPSPETQLPLHETEWDKADSPGREAPARRANELDGQTWTRYSISLWSDIRKSDEERQLSRDHPAMFPQQLVQRVMACFMAPGDKVVLDPFAGTGSTVVAADRSGFVGIGFELYEEYVRQAKARLANVGLFDQDKGDVSVVHHASARNIERYLKRDSVDFVFTSPPYWNVLSRKRTADYKATRDYGEADDDLGNIASYEQFLDSLVEIFQHVQFALKPGKYCVVNVMDLRKQDHFYPFHSDLATRLGRVGFEWDDMIIWDRRHEYNNMRPLGYPAVFRINKAHEYLLVLVNRK